MKKTKILAPALAVLALGMAASVTGTVAWYAANVEVIGSGMHVNCATSRNLVICNSSHSGWAATATATNATTTTLSPVSTTDANDYTKYFKVADAAYVDYNTGNIKNGGATTPALNAAIAESANGGYVRKDTFYVMLDAVTTEKIDLQLESIEVVRTDETSPISKAIRMALVTTYDEKSLTANAAANIHMLDNIYAPFGNAADVTYDAISAAGTVANQNAGMSVTAYKTGENADLTTSVTASHSLPASNYLLVKDFAGTQEVKLEIYTWLEGADPNCTSANSVNIDDITLTVKFNYPNS